MSQPINLTFVTRRQSPYKYDYSNKNNCGSVTVKNYGQLYFLSTDIVVEGFVLCTDATLYW